MYKDTTIQPRLQLINALKQEQSAASQEVRLQIDAELQRLQEEQLRRFVLMLEKKNAQKWTALNIGLSPFMLVHYRIT